MVRSDKSSRSGPVIVAGKTNLADNQVHIMIRGYVGEWREQIR